MSHDLEMNLDGSANMAFVGADPWHRLGQTPADPDSLDSWLDACRGHWTIKSGSAYFYPMLDGRAQQQLSPETIPNCKHWYRSDSGEVFYTGTDQYQGHQPREVADFLMQYVKADPRFRFETMGFLKGGRQFWALAKFEQDFTVAGDPHRAYLLATTSFDGSMATTAQGTLIRVVCNNTLTASMMDKRAAIKIRHTSKFDAAKRESAGAELAQVAQQFSAYKDMGDAMAQARMGKQEVAQFFKDLLEIPREATREDISGKKRNAYDQLVDSLGVTVRERRPDARSLEWVDKFECLNAVTRFVDHERGAGGSKSDEDRLQVANFGSGALLKTRAVALLEPELV